MRPTHMIANISLFVLLTFWAEQTMLRPDTVDAAAETTPALKVGGVLPDAIMRASDGRQVRLSEKTGRVKLVSIVPQLNTPVCDEQTHRFSEQNGGLDKQVEILTLSTNTAEDQRRFANKAKITNITFLSDAPAYDFGKRTGLLLPQVQVLHRAVLVADTDNVIRYVQLVPMGELPNFEAAYDAARQTLRGR